MNRFLTYQNLKVSDPELEIENKSSWPMWVKQNTGKSSEAIGMRCHFAVAWLLPENHVVTFECDQVCSGVDWKEYLYIPDKTVVPIWQASVFSVVFIQPPTNYDHYLNNIFLVGIISVSSYLIILEEKHKKQLVVGVEDVDASHNHWGSSLFSDAPDAVTWA